MKQIGKYQIIDYLGSGAYAEVYKAEDAVLHRLVALKLLKPAFVDDEESVARFIKEAQTAASLTHPQIAWVWDVGEHEGRHYIAIRYIDGQPLSQLLQAQGGLPWEKVRLIFEQLCAALAFAHDRGLIHRDVKPQNIMISPSDGAVLTDFGLARAVEGRDLSRTKSMVGTPAYMAPEIWQGEPAEAASDQYSLACVLVEMLTGKPLFNAPTPPAVMLRHFEPLVLPEQWPANCPVDLPQAIQRALSRKSQDRFPSIAAFLAAVVSLADKSAMPELTDIKSAIEMAFQDKNWDEISRLIARAEALEPGDRNIQHYRRKLLLASAAQGQSESPDERSFPGTLRRTQDRILIRVDNNQEMAFVRIPAGEFRMGSDDRQDAQTQPDEHPHHPVNLPEYWLGQTPVTQAQYAAFVQDTRHAAPAGWQNNRPPENKLNHPVVQVSWHDAVAYCAWLSELTRQLVRLPTEAEWEKAARGTDQRLYPWGNQAPAAKHCNHGVHVRDTTPVGQYSPLGDSPYGIMDLAGNVLEWCADWYAAGYYASSPTAGPAGPNSGKFRVLRGGSWLNDAAGVRATRRYWNVPDNRYNSLGFRCVLIPVG